MLQYIKTETEEFNHHSDNSTLDNLHSSLLVLCCARCLLNVVSFFDVYVLRSPPLLLLCIESAAKIENSLRIYEVQMHI